MKLILHIGTEKTGTSTVQRWFWENRLFWSEKGIHYPASLGSLNHRKLSVFAQDPNKPDDGFFKYKVQTPDLHRLFSLGLTHDFNEEYSANRKTKTWIVSNEYLHSRLTTESMVRRIHDFFEKKFEDIKVIIHLRPQIDLAVSLASTAARVGKQVNLDWFDSVRGQNPYYNYDQLVTRWESVFGAENIALVAFKREPNIISYLCELLELGTDKLPEFERSNEFLGWRTIALCNAIGLAAFERDGTINHNRNIFVNDLPKSERIQLGLERSRKIQSRFDLTNSNLIKRRNDLKESDLSPDWNKFDAYPNTMAFEDKPVFSEQLAYLVSRYNWEIKLERCNFILSECEVFLYKNAKIAAKNKLREFNVIAAQIPNNKVASGRLKSLREKSDRLSQQLGIILPKTQD